MALSAISGSGEQTTTQNPQSSAQSSSAGQASSIQPGTTTSLLTGSGGVPLSAGNLTTVSLSPNTSTQTVSNPPIAHHHTNPVLVGLSAALFVIAILMFWLTSRSEKNTTIR